MASEAHAVAEAVSVTLLAAIREGGVGAGVAVDLARRIADRAAFEGVSLDDLDPLIAITEGRRL